MKATISAEKFINLYNFISNFVEKDKDSVFKHQVFLVVNNNKLYFYCLSNTDGIKLYSDGMTECIVWEDCFDTEDGKILLLWKGLQVINSLNKECNIEISFNEEDNNFIIKDNNSTYKILSKKYDEKEHYHLGFTELKTVNCIASMDIKKEDLVGLKHVALAVSKDIYRKSFIGISYQNNHFVSTDGHRMHVYYKPCENESFGSIIPPSIVKCFNKGIIGQLKEFNDSLVNEHWFKLEGENYKIISKAIMDSFPKFEKVMPVGIPEEQVAPIEVNKFLKEIKKYEKQVKDNICQFHEDLNNITHFKIIKNGEIEPCCTFNYKTYHFPTEEIGIDIHYLVDVLTNMKGVVRFEWIDADSPLLFVDKQGLSGVVMPKQCV